MVKEKEKREVQIKNKKGETKKEQRVCKLLPRVANLLNLPVVQARHHFYFIPERTLREAEPVWGSFDILSILLWSREGRFTLLIYCRKFAFLKS